MCAISSHTPPANLLDNSLTGNTASNNGGAGILVEEVVGVILTGNTLDNNEDGIDIDETTSGTISGNVVKNNASDGIFVSNHSAGNTFTGNTVTGNAASSALSASTWMTAQRALAPTARPTRGTKTKRAQPTQSVC